MALVGSLGACQETEQADERFCRSTLAASGGLSALARLPADPQPSTIEDAVMRVDEHIDDIASDWPSDTEPLLDRFVAVFTRIESALDAGQRPAAADVALVRADAEKMLDEAEGHCGFELPG